MKKALCALLAVVMLLTLCSCGKAKNEPTYNDAGYYDIFSIDDGEDVLSQSDFESLDWVIYLQLNDDGTGVLDYDDGDVYDVTWQDGSITLEGDTVSYAMAGGMLTLDLSDSDGTFVMIFKKGTAPAAEESSGSSLGGGLFGRGGAAADEGLAGYYEAYFVNDNGNELDRDALIDEGLFDYVYLELLEDGTGTVSIGDPIAITWDESSISAEGETVPIAVDGDQITLDFSDDSAALTVIFQKADGAAPAPEAEPEAEPEADPEAAEGAPIGEFAPVGDDLGDYYVEIVGAEQFTDSDGKDAVRFYYDFTNNSDEVTSAWWEMNFEAEEDGYALVSTYASYEDDVPEYGNRSLSVEPGVTIRCIEEYSFQPTGGSLVFTISTYNDGEITATFDPQALPGRPGDWAPELIPEPTFYEGYSSEGTSDYAYVAITGAEIVEQDSWYGDDNVVRVYFDYTNYEEEESYITSETTIRVYQDGIELESSYAEDEIDSDDLWWEDIPSGESTSVSRCWALHSDSPVEVAVIDWWSDEVLCAAVFYPAD